MNRSERSRALNEALGRLGTVVETVKTCVVVDVDGFAIAAYPSQRGQQIDGALNATRLAAVAAALAGTAERSLDRLGQGDMGRLLLESDSGTLLSCPAGPATLALLVAPDASLGHVLFAAQKTAAEIAAIFAQN